LEKLSMKKTLIALAVLAASGASFAQSSVTLSGKLAFGYQKNAAGLTAAGVTDGDLKVTATEDLGGGLKATAAAEFGNRGRDNANSARDASITVSGDFGSLMVGAIEAGNGIIGNGMGGAPVSLNTGFDGLVLSGASNVDIIKLNLPTFSGFTPSVSYTDGTSTATGSTGATSTGFGVTYAAGPLSANADITNFNNGTGGVDSRTRVAAAYDLGVVKLGAGYQTVKYTDNATNKQTVFGFSAPVGALKVGASYATNNQAYGSAVTTATYGAKSAWVYAADYSLSKRTALNVSLSSTPKVGTSTASITESQYRVRLLHAF
jgi:predicted porin